MPESESFFAWVFVPSDFGGDKRTGDDIYFSIAVDIEREVAVALDVAVPVVNISQGARNEGRAWVPVPPCDDIRFGVAVDICDRATFVGIEGQRFNFPSDSQRLIGTKSFLGNTPGFDRTK